VKLHLYAIVIVTGLQVWPNIAYSLDREDCVEMMAASGNDWAARSMFAICLREDSYFFNRSKNISMYEKGDGCKG
jgi:hypothetical protein